MSALSELLYSMQRNYVCAVCWGNLSVVVIKNDNGKTEERLICHKAQNGDCTGKGFVTRRYSEKRREASLGEAIEVKHTYPELFPVKKLTEKNILSELGF